MPELARGRSVDPEGRRVNAVSPMHLSGESAMLKNLWQEAQVQQHQQEQQAYEDTEKDRMVQQMLEKYQNQVRQQQQTVVTTGSQDASVIIAKGQGSHENRSSGQLPPSYSSNTTMSHSQPCLITISDKPEASNSQPLPSHFNRCSSIEQQDPNTQTQTKHIPPTSNQKIIQSLREENLHLKQQLEALKKKTARLEHLETAHDRIEKEYESLMRDKDKQDTLEKSAFVTMDIQIKRLVKENEALQDRLEQLSSSGAPQTMDQLSKLNLLVAEIIPQNNEMKASIKRQTLELQAQRATLEEQRTHIAMLETALTNAQERLARKEKMCEEQSAATERIAYLQRLLHDALCDKQARDESHAEDRAKLEMEITQLKMHINKDSGGMGGIKKGSTRGCSDSSDENVVKLKKVIHTKDERITHLEKNVMELQRKMHEETEKKNSALEALSDSLESKIKRLEDEKIDKDRRIAELTEEKERMGELLDEQREDEDARRDLHKMEELRQRIEERKRRQRQEVSATGSWSDHNHSPSGSTITSSSHLRPSTNNYDLFDSSALFSELSNQNRLANCNPSTMVSSQYGLRTPTLTYGFFHSQDRDEQGNNVWNV